MRPRPAKADASETLRCAGAVEGIANGVADGPLHVRSQGSVQLCTSSGIRFRKKSGLSDVDFLVGVPVSNVVCSAHAGVASASRLDYP